MIFKVAVQGLADEVTLALKANAFTVSLDEREIFYFDHAGRLLGAYLDGHNFKRGLDNAVMEKWGWRNGGHRERIRKMLDDGERRRFLDRVQATLSRIELATRDMSLASGDGSWVQVRGLLVQIASNDFAALERDAARFRAIYSPVGILPPDQYMALVLQATEGCSYNRCTFCDFYRGKPFRIKDEGAFRQHVQAVQDYLGPALGLRKSIFLADANALVIPQDPLLRIFDIVNEAFPIAPDDLDSPALNDWEARYPLWFHGIYCFIDVFTGYRKSLADFRALAARNLRRVYIGLESGHDPLRRLLNKPGLAADVLHTVETVRQAGIAIGVIIMAGIGGDRYAAAHVKDTVKVVRAMPLGRGDLVYLSEFVDHPGSEYARRAAEEGIRPLSPQGMRDQIEAIRTKLAFAGPDGPQVSIYDIREFIY